MPWLPVIARELRSEARQAATYWMRVIAAGIALGVALLGALQDWGRQWTGNDVFNVVQPTLFSLIWLLAPIMTCDAISRERREGTLGLLLLTLLRPMDVGLAKACSGILRSLSIVLAVLPMLSIALLLGGVSGTELLRAALMNGMALVAAITSGLLASSRCREFHRAAVLALLYAVLALMVLGNFQSLYYLVDYGFLNRMDHCAAVLLLGPWVLCAGITEIWRQRGGALPSVGYLWLSVFQMLLAMLFLGFVLNHLNRRLRSLAVESGRSARMQWWWQVLCTPRLFTGYLKRRQLWLLNRNPIGWLQRRTWSARLATWGWVGVVSFVETALISNGPGGPDLREIRDLQLMLAGFVAIGMAFSAANSFRQERESGALELLLVTPLQVRQIIVGRLFGLWGQYLLVFVMLVGMWCYTSSWRWPAWISGRGTDILAQAWFMVLLLLVSTFLLVPVIGLNQSMLRKHFITSWIVTLAYGLVPQVLLLVTALYAINLGGTPNPSMAPESVHAFLLLAIGLQALFGTMAAVCLHRNLTQRHFATGP